MVWCYSMSISNLQTDWVLRTFSEIIDWANKRSLWMIQIWLKLVVLDMLMSIKHYQCHAQGKILTFVWSNIEILLKKKGRRMVRQRDHWMSDVFLCYYPQASNNFKIVALLYSWIDWLIYFKNQEAVVRRCSVKKEFLEISQRGLQLYQKRFSGIGVFLRLCEISENTFFHRTPPVAASESQ